METIRLITLQEASRRLRVPRPWLREEAEAGRVPCLRAGSRMLFNLAVVERLLVERASQGGPRVND